MLTLSGTVTMQVVLHSCMWPVRALVFSKDSCLGHNISRSKHFCLAENTLETPLPAAAM